jgi:1-acyl-sn-glycerol-3-phosphate acyltransferase
VVKQLLDAVGRVVFWLCCRIDMHNLENLPTTGPVILMLNHVNFLDVVVVSVLLPRQPVGMAKEELLQAFVVGPLLRAYGVIPVRRGEVDRQALRRAEALLKEGRHTLMIAPEGHRSGSGQLQAGRAGLAFIAVRNQALVVPVAVSGGEHVWRNLLALRRTKLTLSFGPGFRFKTTGTKLDHDSLRLMTEEAMYQLAVLLPPAYRGMYSDVAQATNDYLEFAGSGDVTHPA